jgi:hypothetical protein
MHGQMGQKSDIHEKLIRAEQLIDEGRHKEALDLMKNFEEKGKISLFNIISCNLLKCKLLYQQGLYQDVIKLAELTYKESLGLGKSFLSVDALLIMTEALITHLELEKAYDIIKKGEELLKKLVHSLPKEYQKREASLNYEKGRYYGKTHDINLSAQHLEYSLKLREKLDAKPEAAISRKQLAWILGAHKGELDRSIILQKQSLVIFKKYNIKYHIGTGLLLMSALYALIGEVDRAIILQKQSLVIFKELNNKPYMAKVLNNMADSYRMKGDLDHALDCIENSMALCNELGLLKSHIYIYDFFIQILIEKGDLQQAEQKLHRFKQIRDDLKDKYINVWYLFNRALLLKASPKAHNRDKAEEILIQLLENEDIDYEFTIRSLLNLCELLLIKLSSTTNLKVLDQILFYVNQIRNIAEKSYSYWLLAETYLLQAKLELLILDLKKAKESLGEAQKIAKEHGLSQLTESILKEQDILLNQANKWISLKNSTDTVLELSNLTPLKEQIQYMLKKRQLLKISKS